MWQVEAFTLELKRKAAYVIDFWIKMIVPPIAQIIIAYYLWAAIYEQRGAAEIGGYSFHSMILYYVIAASLYQLVQPEMGVVLREIYMGSLTKYLFYPISVFEFKYIGHLAHMCLVMVQLLATVGVYFLIFGIPPESRIGLQSMLLAIPPILIAGYLFFMMSAALETVGLWIESAWSLVVMLQIISGLLGGRLLPLTLFPEWLQQMLPWFPFPYTVSFPTQVFLGHVSMPEYWSGLALGCAWSFLVTSLARFLWNRGSYQYTGTGM